MFSYKEFAVFALVFVALMVADVALAEESPRIDCISSQSLPIDPQQTSRFDCDSQSQPPVPNVTAGHGFFDLYIAGFELKQWSIVYVFYADCTSLPPCNIVYQFSLSEDEHINNFKLQKQITSQQLQNDDIYAVMVYNDPAQAEGDDGVGWSNSAIFTVYNAPPTINNLQLSTTACPISPGTDVASFSWNYRDIDSNNQKKFEFQIDDSSNFSSPVVSRTYDNLANPPNASNGQTINIVVGGNETDALLHNKTYYWRVRVCQHPSNPYLLDCSDWTYQTSETPPNNATTVSPGVSFTTADHPAPYVNFTYAFTSPGLTFNSSNHSFCYDTVAGLAVEASCQSYFWDFGHSSPNNTSTFSDPDHVFPDPQSGPSNYDVKIVITDQDGLQCQKIQNVSIVNASISEKVKFREISPFSFTNDALGTLIIRKETTGGDGQFQFNVGNSCPVCDPFVNENLFISTFNGLGFDQVDLMSGGAITYAITETIPPGWEFVSGECLIEGNPTGSVPFPGDPGEMRIAQISIFPEEITTCRFVNNYVGAGGSDGNLVISVESIGGDETFFLHTQGSGGFDGTDMAITSGGSAFVVVPVPGNFTYATDVINIPPGWVVQTNTCQDILVFPGGNSACQIVMELQ